MNFIPSGGNWDNPISKMGYFTPKCIHFITFDWIELEQKFFHCCVFTIEEYNILKACWPCLKGQGHRSLQSLIFWVSNNFYSLIAKGLKFSQVLFLSVVLQNRSIILRIIQIAFLPWGTYPLSIYHSVWGKQKVLETCNWIQKIGWLKL